MLLRFFIPLVIALVAALIAYQSREEIVKTFSIIIMAISLLVSFAWAPWLLQVLVLALSVGGMRYLCHRHSCQDALKDK